MPVRSHEPFISFFMTAYLTEQYVAEAIESVLAPSRALASADQPRRARRGRASRCSIT
jgi:hypothetical protein